MSTQNNVFLFFSLSFCFLTSLIASNQDDDFNKERVAQPLKVEFLQEPGKEDLKQGLALPAKVVIICFSSNAFNYIRSNKKNRVIRTPFSILGSTLYQSRLKENVFVMPANLKPGPNFMKERLASLKAQNFTDAIVVGTTGTLQPATYPRTQFVLPKKAFYLKNKKTFEDLKGDVNAKPNEQLYNDWIEFSKRRNITAIEGATSLTVDSIAQETEEVIQKSKEKGLNVVDMEAFELFKKGAKLNIKTMALFTVSDEVKDITLFEASMKEQRRSPDVDNAITFLTEEALNFCESYTNF